jgi:hypothetical protein
MGCRHSGKSNEAISIEWNGSKPIGILIPESAAGDVPVDSLKYVISVKLAGNITPILGEYSIAGQNILFRPLIPLSHGLEYEVWSGQQLSGKIEVPVNVVSPAPDIISVYPTTDTVPENLLKMHILFSTPMQEGEALKNIFLLNSDKDTMHSVFLDLQPELWNKEKTSLTLWLDPGRIKRDLQPNKELGNPLHKGERYELIIGKDWQSADGVTLNTIYQKKFVVGARDDLSPDPAQWEIDIPKAGTKDALKISFKESLDFVLAENTIRITDTSDNILNGRIEMERHERFLMFYPPADWKPGQYTIEVESRLEDMAGNNLERLFDNDLNQQKKTTGKKIFKRMFAVR